MKRKNLIVAIIMSILCISFSLVACDKGKDNPPGGDPEMFSIENYEKLKEVCGDIFIDPIDESRTSICVSSSLTKKKFDEKLAKGGMIKKIGMVYLRDSVDEKTAMETRIYIKPKDLFDDEDYIYYDYEKMVIGNYSAFYKIGTMSSDGHSNELSITFNDNDNQYIVYYQSFDIFTAFQGGNFEEDMAKAKAELVDYVTQMLA